jgi:predicted porin
MEIYMNKKLIAIAIAAAVSAPAMAATSNVEVYGLLSAGVDSVTNANGNGTATVSGSTNRAGRVSDYASRIGFKGSEDLGNGLKGIWQIEQAVAINGGNGTNSNGNISGTDGAFAGAGLRNTFVGLSSKDMGTALIGKHDTPYKMSTARLDQFGDTLGDYNGLMGAGYNPISGNTNSNGYFDLRPANVAAYITPNFSGFSAVAAYVFGGANATSGSASGNAYSMAAMYDAGPLYLTAAYEKHNLGSVSSGSLGFSGVPANSSLSRKAWKLGAQYSIMDFTLGTAYEKSDDNFNNGANEFGHNTWFLSGKYQMGAVALKAQYAKASSAGSAANQGGAKQYTLGADYSFSKRTTVYALYTAISNDNNGGYNFADNVNPVAGNTTNTSISGVSIGVKHSF